MGILGMKVKDVTTGFAGVALARIQTLYGGAYIGVQCQDLHNGKPIPIQWFDEKQLAIGVDPEPEPKPDEAGLT